ncbi:branched-chain amino acid ABC transporter permease [Rhodobacteraceae bacterium]|nr:branched-chain amino acid ABC transporter permease [Paracoccaceae bacterium]
MWIVRDSIFIGLLEASPLILAAMGFTLIYYLNGFINFAYGENMTFGAYFAVMLNVGFGLNFYVAIVPAALLAGCLSVASYLFIFRPALNRGVKPSEMIILSVGLSFMLRYGLVLFVGAENAYLNEPPIGFYNFMGLGATNLQLIALILVIIFALNLYWLIYKTNFGEVIRGLANNEDLAQVSGINPHKVSVKVWFIAGVAGGLSGIFSGVFALANPQMGWNLILITIMVSIVAGVGSVRGALVASIVAGILTSFITLISKPLYAEVVLLVAFILILWQRRGKMA